MKFSDYDKKFEERDKLIEIERKEKQLDFDYKVSRLITEARMFKGLTQEELADLVGTKQPSIARIESGKSLPTLNFLKKIAKAIRVGLIPPMFDFMLHRDSELFTTEIKPAKEYPSATARVTLSDLGISTATTTK